jgi:hypothetical protein
VEEMKRQREIIHQCLLISSVSGGDESEKKERRRGREKGIRVWDQTKSATVK